MKKNRSSCVEQPFFSVVIPIYNVDKYLQRCVDSVLKQEFDNIEIILVDDGSPDSSPQICDRYAKKDKRILAIHKQNGGLSSARNAGIKSANGKYIIFLDSDDFWEGENCLNNIYARIKFKEQTDVLFYRCMDYSSITNTKLVSQKEYDCDFIKNNSRDEVLNYLFKNELFPGAAWLIVTRRDFLIDNDLFFIEGIKAEDIDWLLNVFLKAQKFEAINDALYIYVKYRTDSITGTADIKSAKDILFTINKWLRELEKEIYINTRENVYKYLLKHYLCAVLILDKLPREKKNEMISVMKDYCMLLKYDMSLKGKICRWVYKFGGLGCLSKLLNLYRIMRMNT